MCQKMLQILTKLVNDNFEQIDFKVAFKASNEIGKKFPFKDSIKESKEQSLAVYKIKCQTCNEIYIGKTELVRRIKENKTAKIVNQPYVVAQRRKSRTRNRRSRHRNNRP